MNKLIEFYLHNGTDDYGRSLKDMWTWDHFQLEKVHDYIQWMFPTATPSQYNHNAPLVDAETIEVFKNSSELQSYLITSSFIFERFLDLDNPNAHWLTNKNHNFLRITRVIESLMVLNCRPRAHQFYGRVEKAYLKNEICPISYWSNMMLTHRI